MANPVLILLVEDSEDDVILTQRALKKMNLVNRVEVVRDGAEALDYLFKRSETDMPYVVLLDLNLPKIGGLEVLRRIKETKSTQNIPVIMLTTSERQPDLEAAYELGANSYIRKPVDSADFQQAINEVGNYWLILNVLPEPDSDNRLD